MSTFKINPALDKAVKKEPKLITVYDEYHKRDVQIKEDSLKFNMFKAIKKYDFETNTIIEEAYTSLSDTIVKAYNKNGDIIEFVSFDAAMNHPELHYRASTWYFYHNTLVDKPKKTNWNPDYQCSFIKSRLTEDKKVGLTPEQFELAYKRGQITTSYNVTKGLKYTFGYELETSSGHVPPFIQSMLNCKTVRDGSCTGAEVVSGIIAGDSGFYQLNQTAYHYARACKINHKCGVHVHLGNVEFTKTFNVAMYKLGLLIQNEIFSMFPLSRQRTRNEYYINKGMFNGCCYKIPMLNGFEKKLNIEDKCVGDTMKKVEDMYHEMFTWLSGGNIPDSKKNKLQKHPAHYPDARYVWLNFICCNFNRTKYNFKTSNPKEKQDNLKLLNEAATIEFRNHPASLSYRKISNWILICMALVNYAENNSYKILAADSITLKDVIDFTYGDYGKFLLTYIEECKAKYKGLTEEESAKVEDEEYKKDVKETKLFKNKLEVICV